MLMTRRFHSGVAGDVRGKSAKRKKKWYYVQSYVLKVSSHVMKMRFFNDCQCKNRDNDTNDSSLVYSPFPAHLVIPYVKVGCKDWGLNYMKA